MHSEFLQSIYYAVLFAMLLTVFTILLGVLLYDVVPWICRMLKVIFWRKE